MAWSGRWLMDEGTGNTLNDSIASNDFTAYAGDNIKWCSGKVFGLEKSFITVGHTDYPRYDGLLTGKTGGISPNWQQGCVAFVGRVIANKVDGTVIKETDFNIRTTGKTLDLSTGGGTTLIQESEMKFGEWAVYMLVGRSGQYLDVYLNDMVTPLRTVDFGVGGLSFGGSIERMLSGGDDTDVGGMELADVAHTNNTIPSQAEREAYKAEFMGQIPNFRMYKETNDDFGGLYRYDFDSGGGGGSELLIVEVDGHNVVKHQGNGLSCCIGVYTELPRGMNEIWIEGDFQIPVGFKGNNTIGDNVNFLNLYENDPVLEANNIVSVRGKHNITNNNITLDKIIYTNTGGATTYNLDGTLLEEGLWHHFTLRVNLSQGIIQFWDESVLRADLSGLTLDRSIDQAYWGLALGVRPANPQPYILSRSHYVSDLPEHAGGSGGEFSARANYIIFRKFFWRFKNGR